MAPPPLGRQDSRISIELYAKVRHSPSLCYLGRKFQLTNKQNLGEDFFWPKTGLNLSEDLLFLFFFWSSPNFGQQNRLILSGAIFLMVFILVKISGPPFQKSCVRYWF